MVTGWQRVAYYLDIGPPKAAVRELSAWWAEAWPPAWWAEAWPRFGNHLEIWAGNKKGVEPGRTASKHEAEWGKDSYKKWSGDPRWRHAFTEEIKGIQGREMPWPQHIQPHRSTWVWCPSGPKHTNRKGGLDRLLWQFVTELPALRGSHWNVGGGQYHSRWNPIETSGPTRSPLERPSPVKATHAALGLMDGP